MIITRDLGFYKALFKLTAPLAVYNLIIFLIALTDSLMIGRLGEGATASAYVGTLSLSVLQMLLTGSDGGIGVLASQYYGKGDMESVKRILSISFFFSLALSFLPLLASLLFPSVWFVLFSKGASSEAIAFLRISSISFPLLAISHSICSVFRSIEAVKISAFSAVCTFVINLIFNYLLIFGKSFFTINGIKGAAVATVIARSVELLVNIFYLFFIDKKLSFSLRDILRIDIPIARKFLKYTSPILGGQIVWIFNTLFAAYILSEVNTGSGIAGVALANTLNSLSYVLMNSLAAAVGIIIGKTIGKNELSRIREYSYTTEILFLTLGIVCGAILFICAKPFTNLYNVSEEARLCAKSLITVLSVSIIGTHYQSACLIALVKSGGDASFILKNDAVFIFLIVVPLSLLAVKMKAPVFLVFSALKSDQVLKCIPAAIKINRFDWIKRLTEKGKDSTFDIEIKADQ